VPASSGLPSLVIPRKTLIRPLLLSARKKSPLGAVRINLGLSSPVAYCCTVNPAGAFGHASCGRAINRGPRFADSVAYGAGRSRAVILRIFPGCSKRKSVYGVCGAGASVFTGFRLAGIASGDAEALCCALWEFLSDFK